MFDEDDYLDPFVENEDYELNDINSQIADENSHNSCFKNAICNIKTNLNFDLTKFTNLFAGQKTSSLPASRITVLINEKRYTYLVYKTGTIMLTNLFFTNEINKIFNYFINLLIYCVCLGIAEVQSEEKEEEGEEASEGGASSDGMEKFESAESFTEQVLSKIKVSFLIENMHFSIQIDKFKFLCPEEDEYDRIGIELRESLQVATVVKNIEDDPEIFAIFSKAGAKMSKYFIKFFLDNFNTSFLYNLYLHNFKTHASLSKKEVAKFSDFIRNIFFGYEKLEKKNDPLKKIDFPAKITKYFFKRQNPQFRELLKYKSEASQKRHRQLNTFNRQKISIHMFKNGKFIITGGQTYSDLENIKFLIRKIVLFFLDRE